MRVASPSAVGNYPYLAFATALLFPVAWVALGILLLPVGIGVPILILGAPVIAGAYPFLGAGTSAGPTLVPVVGVILSLVQWTLLSLLLTAAAMRFTFTKKELVVATLVAVLIVSAIVHAGCALAGVPLNNYSFHI